MIGKRIFKRRISICLSLFVLLLYSPLVMAEKSMSDGAVAAEQNGPAGADLNTEDSSNSSNSGQGGEASEPGVGQVDSSNTDSSSQETDLQTGTNSSDAEGQQPDNQNLATTGQDSETEMPVADNPEPGNVSQPQVATPQIQPVPEVIPLKLAGSVCDSTVSMSAGYINIFAGDNSWEISLNTGTLKGGVGDDLTNSLNIEGLPEGLSWTARNGGDNKILITVSGPASNMVLESTQVSVIVKGSAVNEADASDSNALSLNLNLNGPSPDAIAVDPAGTALYILIRESGQVLVVDVSSDSIRRTISLQNTPETGPEAMNDISIALGMLAVLK